MDRASAAGDEKESTLSFALQGGEPRANASRPHSSNGVIFKMRTTHGLVAASFVGLLAGAAWSYEGSTFELRQPPAVQQVAFEYDSAGYTLISEASQAEPEEATEPKVEDVPSASPSDAAEPAAPAAAPPICYAPAYREPKACAGETCFMTACPKACGPCDIGCCGAKKSPFTYGGWVSAGIYANAWGAKSNGPLTMRQYGNGFTVDQTWFYFEKAVDTGGYGWDYGGRVDFVWGADGPDTQCFGDGGWDGNWFTSNDQNYGSAIPQLYGEVAYNDVSIKIGHFYTIIGYEVVPAPDNFFYSHSYALAYEPFTHVGALASYKYNDRVTFHGGWVNGWDNGWLNPSGGSMFLGGVSFELTKRLTLTYATSFGQLWSNFDNANIALADTTGYMHSLVLEAQLTDRLEYVFQSDFLTTQDAYGTTENIRRYGVNQYLFYTLNSKWKVGSRVEWYRDEIGAVGGAVTTGNYTGATFGFNYRPLENVVFRPEVRWDWTEGSPIGPFPFNDNANSYQFSGGFDMIVTF